MHRQNKLHNSARIYLDYYGSILEKMILNMRSADLTDSISHNFITQMIPHHQAAIEMSQNILKYTNSKPIEIIASGIVEEQTKSIKNMREIELSCENFQNSDQDLWLYQHSINEIMQDMFSNMKCARAANNINCDFMWEMIPHHMGAIEMSETALQYPICPNLKPILNAIIISQQRGVIKMQHLLQYMDCS